jgi:hypothetical protein
MPDTQRLLELALQGLQADRARIDDEIAEIKGQLKRHVTTGTPSGNGTRRRLSAEARKRISEGMKRRHAALRAGQTQGKGSMQAGLTAAGRKKLSEMMKARWAAKKKAAKKAA